MNDQCTHEMYSRMCKNGHSTTATERIEHLSRSRLHYSLSHTRFKQMATTTNWFSSLNDSCFISIIAYPHHRCHSLTPSPPPHHRYCRQYTNNNNENNQITQNNAIKQPQSHRSSIYNPKKATTTTLALFHRNKVCCIKGEKNVHAHTQYTHTHTAQFTL